MNICDRDLEFMCAVLSAFRSDCSSVRGSLRGVSQKFGITRTKVRKILITLGAFRSPLPAEALSLRESGHTLQEIADRFGLAVSTVSMYLPYATVLYNGEEQSVNAVRVRKFREKLDYISEKQLVNRARQDGVSAAPSLFLPVLEDGQSRSVGSCQQQEVVMEGEQSVEKVMRLRLELNLGELGQERWDILRKYGDVKDGISRDILVPASMTLHALHYVILRSFGWLNGHLHHFTVGEMEVQALTEGNFRKLLDWMGVYFRFPVSDDDDIYWDDNYTGEKSFRNWLRDRYTAPYNYGGTSEHFMPVRMSVMQLIHDHKKVKVPPSFQEYIDAGMPKGRRMATTKLLEEVTVEEAPRLFEESIGQLLERLTLTQLLGRSEQWLEEAKACQQEALLGYERNISRVEELQREMLEAARQKTQAEKKGRKGKPEVTHWQEVEDDAWQLLHAEVHQMNPRVTPIANSLHYEYDYGDGWEVTVTCEGIYGQEDNDQLSPEVAEQVRQVQESGRPLCIAMDGKRLLDDVGGVYGYCGFLKVVNGEDKEAKEGMIEWARRLDWNGRRCSPDKLL